MIKKPFQINRGIQEYDIIDLGGSVEYTGNVVERRQNYVMEDAIIALNGTQCEARIQR